MGTGGTTSIKSKWENGLQRFYDSATDETVQVMAPLWFKEDFLGEEELVSEAGSQGIWNTIDVGDATEAIVTGGGAASMSGVFRLHIAATNEAEDAVLDWADNTSVSVLNDTQIEIRATLTTLPTTGVTAVWGMAGAHNLAKDSVAESAWFRLDASGALDVETDDTTNDNDDVSTGLTCVAGTYNIYRIDFSVISDVKFYVDGVRYATGTTFDMSNLTATEALMQPYFSLDKASGTGVGDLDIDYVAIWGRRTSSW